MRDLGAFDNYTLISKEELSDINGFGYVYEHNKTKARIVLLDNEDENKSFVIGFKTPQWDSTGLPHILEHSVLCGSKKYPVKDAMTEVGKGSLNTFMNAFTYPDRTIYPVSSCNEKDLNNLMSVYLDAVFNPMVYEEPKIFMQEGWHYELDNADAELKVNGVVYNEMKGDYSNPDSLFRNEIVKSLFPDTQYYYDAGGNPECIPQLKYDDFVSFHKKLYHPSNSKIILYGNMDFKEKMKFIDEEYLSKYEYLSFENEISMQTPFDKPVFVETQYPISEDEPTEEATYLSYNVVVSDYTDVETCESIDVINYALCSVPGAILKERLINAGIGKDVYAEYSEDMAQKTFSIIADGANSEDKDSFVKIIEETIKEVVANGYDKKAIEAAITNQEFSYREADFGNYPKGIVYSMMIMDQYNYTEDNIFNQMKQADVFNKLRNKAKDGYFEKLTEKLILNNTHKSIVVMQPKVGLQDEIDKALSDRLASYKATLSDGEILKIVEQTKALKEYQSMEDTQEALATIPTLTIDDISKERKHTVYDIHDVNGVKVIKSDINTNGIMYLTLSFNANCIPNRLIPAYSLLKSVISYVDTEKYSYAELNNELNIKAGGIVGNTLIYKDRLNPDKFDLGFEVRTKVFYQNIKEVFDLIYEMLYTSKLDDKKRLKEIVDEVKTRVENSFISSGHSVAYVRALSKVSSSSMINDKLFGIERCRFLEDLSANFDAKSDDIINQLREVVDLVFNKENLEVSYGAQSCIDNEFDNILSDFINKLPSKEFVSRLEMPHKIEDNEAYTSSMQIQYVALGGNFIKAGFDYDSQIMVVRNILSNEYLWNNVRVLGGAYGSWFSAGRNGDSFFVSYRDPNVSKTVDTYKKAVEYLKEFPDDANLVERFVISTIGEFDSPLTPSMESAKAYGLYKSGLTNEMLDEERINLINTKVSDIRKMSAVIEAVCNENAICVVGNEAAINKEKDMFDSIHSLIGTN